MDTNLIIILGVILIVAIIALPSVRFMLYTMGNEAELVEKAEISKSMFNIYHIWAKLTVPTYRGYHYTKPENDALREWNSRIVEYDKHPIGSFFKLCKSNLDICKLAGNLHDYKLNFHPSDMAIGFGVMAAFAVVVTLGVMLR